MEKKLYRKTTDRMLLGVCAGIADYFRIDVTVIRLAWIILCCFAGTGILAYILAAIIIPEEPPADPYQP